MPLDTDMEHFCVRDITPQIKILHVGSVFYSTAVWDAFEYYSYEDKGFPKREDLPRTDGILFSDIISKCWNREYVSMEALSRDVHDLSTD